MTFFNISDTQYITNKTFAYIDLLLEHHIFHITLNRPEKRNAMTPVMMNEIVFALEHARQNNAIRVVVIKANGPVFCAGADLKAFAGEVDEKPSSIPVPAEKVRLGDAFKYLYKPCIAKVHADVYAGGFLLIGGCTHILSASDTKFSLPEINRGIWPFQVMASLAPNIDKHKLLDWCMRGNVINAHEAKEMGIVSEVINAENLDEQCLKLADELSQKAPLAIKKGLEAYEQMMALNEHDRHAYLLQMLDSLLKSEDAQEGIKAFAEKRKPLWKGQ
jgi:enoyl-CoA hydratase/carnithine racemase